MKKITICVMCILLSGCTTIFDAMTPYKEPKTRCKYDDATPIGQLGLDEDLSVSLGDEYKIPLTKLHANLDAEVGTPIDVILYDKPETISLRGRYETTP